MKKGAVKGSKWLKNLFSTIKKNVPEIDDAMKATGPSLSDDDLKP